MAKKRLDIELSIEELDILGEAMGFTWGGVQMGYEGTYYAAANDALDDGGEPMGSEPIPSIAGAKRLAGRFLVLRTEVAVRRGDAR